MIGHARSMVVIVLLQALSQKLIISHLLVAFYGRYTCGSQKDETNALHPSPGNPTNLGGEMLCSAMPLLYIFPGAKGPKYARPKHMQQDGHEVAKKAKHVL